MIHQKIKNDLPGSSATAFTYIGGLNHYDQPNYKMIKLWFAFNLEQEQEAFKTKLKVVNDKSLVKERL